MVAQPKIVLNRHKLNICGDLVFTFGGWFVAEKAINVCNPVPRAAFALVLPPDNVAQGAPDVGGDLGWFEPGPIGLGFQCSNDRPAVSVIGGAVVSESFVGAFAPFVAFHARRMAVDRGGCKDRTDARRMAP